MTTELITYGNIISKYMREIENKSNKITSFINIYNNMTEDEKDYHKDFESITRRMCYEKHRLVTELLYYCVSCLDLFKTTQLNMTLYNGSIRWLNELENSQFKPITDEEHQIVKVLKEQLIELKNCLSINLNINHDYWLRKSSCISYYDMDTEADSDEEYVYESDYDTDTDTDNEEDTNELEDDEDDEDENDEDDEDEDDDDDYDPENDEDRKQDIHDTFSDALFWTYVEEEPQCKIGYLTTSSNDITFELMYLDFSE